MLDQFNNEPQGRGASQGVNGSLYAVSKKLQANVEKSIIDTTAQELDDASVTATEIQSVPLDGFGATIQEYIANIAETSGTSTNPVAASCIASAAAVMSNKVHAVLRDDDGNVKYKVSPIIFTCYVDDAAQGKSQSVNIPVEPITEIDKDLYRRWVDAVKSCETTPEPRLQQIIIGDSTPQGVVASIKDNCDELNNMICGALMCDDELNGFFKQVADAKGTDFIKLLCKAFDGVGYKVNRATTGKTIFNNFMLSFIGAIQSDALRKKLNDDFLITGFVQRFIWTFDDGQPRRKKHKGQDKTLCEYWSQTLNELYHMERRDAPLEFSKDAADLYWRWVDNCEDYKELSGNKNIYSFVNKHSYFVLRLALIFAVLHHQDAILYDDVKHAIAVCNYCLYADNVLLGLVQFGENISNLDQSAIIFHLVSRCTAKGEKPNLTEISRGLKQCDNWASSKLSLHKRRLGIKTPKPKNDDEQEKGGVI